MVGKINPNKRSKVYDLGSSLRARLAMMSAKKKSNLLDTASHIAETSIKAEDKATEKPRPTTAYESGARVREMIVRTGAIITDPTGNTAEAMINQVDKNQELIDEKRRKHEEEKYGGPPTVIERIIHGIGDLEDLNNVELTRRDLLVGKPKEGAKEIARELGPTLLPWPLYKIAKILGF